MPATNAPSASTSATMRLRKDYLRLKKDPVPYVQAEPMPNNILEWHYCVHGPPNSPFQGGIYHGKLVFPADFPFKPPAIYMLTPNGRFKINTRLCLSISDFHPDTWNPAWSVATILTGLLSFMLEDSPTYGSVTSSEHEKRSYAFKSLEYNLKCKTFCNLFPNIVEDINAALKVRQANTSTANDGSGSGSESSGWDGALLNLVVLVSVGLLAFVVRYVVQASDGSI